MTHELGRADGPALVLLHGFTDSCLCWPDAVRRWRGDYRIVAPDARGHGESLRFDTTTGGSNRSEVMVADVVSLLEGLTRESDQLPILVGHSMGAGIAAIVLAARPDLVCAAVLEDPPWIDTAAAIVRPTLLVTGGRDDAVIVGPLSQQRLAALGNHHIEVVVVPRARHTVRRDCSDAYHQIVDPWIRGAAGS